MIIKAVIGVKQNTWFNNSNFKIIISFLIIIIFLSYCATKPKVITRENEREILRDRIQEYWQYQIGGMVDKAYQCEIPRYREKVPMLGYLNRYKLVQYLEADVLEIGVKGNEGNAIVKLKYRVLLKHISKTDIIKTTKENWAKIENFWYHIPEGFEM